MRKVFLEIAALFENHWTGIPSVVAVLADNAMRDKSIDWRFCFDNIELPRWLVQGFLDRRTGAGGLEAVSQYAWEDRYIKAGDAQSGIGIYTNIKSMRRFFGKEAMLIYDLSPVLSPQFHNKDNIEHFANRIRSDIASSDHIFCISRTGMTDVNAYFGKPLEDISIIQMGVDFDESHLSAANMSLWGFSPEPYVVIVGTLEPRKNGQIMLDYLVQHPEFASRFRVVFVGRDGWLEERERLLDLIIKAGVDENRILFAGFLSEADKTALIMNASFCIYPSFFEGYGLPVLEAAALGKVTVCSNSSSIPEVDPGSSVFFNPSSIHEFGQAVEKAELRAAQTRSRQQSLADIIERITPLSWKRCYDGVAQWVHDNTDG